MDCTTSRTANAVVAHPVGRIENGSWEGFEAALEAALDEAVAAGVSLIIDLAGIEYMISRGLRVLTRVNTKAKAAGVTISLARPNALVAQILEISRYHLIFSIHDTIEPGG